MEMVKQIVHHRGPQFTMNLGCFVVRVTAGGRLCRPIPLSLSHWIVQYWTPGLLVLSASQRLHAPLL